MYRRQSPASQHDRQVSNCQPAKRRAGLITFWALVTIPVFLTMLCVVLEIGNLWAARIQLKNALEAAAMAGVQNWGDGGGGDTTAARAVANTYSSANIINGAPVVLTAIDANLNDDLTNTDNDNVSCTGVLVFGVVTSSPATGFVFEAARTDGCAMAPDPPPLDLPFAVRAQATMAVPSICNSLFGFTIGDFNVTARADALYECSSGQPRIYHVDDANFMCP